MNVAILDLGGGDAIVVIFPNGRVMLIDGGDRSDGPKVLDFLQRQGIRSIDVVVATHPHSDHMGGLAIILNRIPVKMFLDSGLDNPDAKFDDEFRDLLRTKGIPVQIATAGLQVDIDPLVQVLVLAPPKELIRARELLSANSLVIKVTYGRTSFLFPADAEPETEEFLAREYGSVIDIDILVASHHGSLESNRPRFLQSTSPKAVIVIFSTIIRSAGYPNTILDRLKAVTSNVCMTGIKDGEYATVNGTIVIVSDAMTYRILPERDSQLLKCRYP